MFIYSQRDYVSFLNSNPIQSQMSVINKIKHILKTYTKIFKNAKIPLFDAFL